jgi:predicted DNA-binding ribbon-helix-helix protein
MKKSPIARRSVIIGGRRTSVSVEDEFWTALREIAEERGTSLAALVTEIDRKRTHKNLSSAIRVFILEHRPSRRSQRADGE